MYGPGDNLGLLETCNSSSLSKKDKLIITYHQSHIKIVPHCRTQISTPVLVQGLERVHVIAVGAFHNLALLEDGVLWAWGSNEYGQLGTGDTQPRSQPIPVQGLSGLTLVSSVIM
jgi:alpha-tubulin suppressor-like RCC1 family protein